MNYKVVAFALNFGWPVNKEEYVRLGAEYFEIPCKTEVDYMDATADADAVFVPLEPLNRRIIANMRRCRIISVAGVGYDYVDVEAATEHGICVSNVPDYCTEEMSEHTMALLLACARKICLQVNGVRSGEWDTLVNHKILSEVPPLFKLQGQTLGIVGIGRIGSRVIPKAKGLGMKIIAYDPYVTSYTAREIGVELVDFTRLLEESDFVSLHAPLNDETRLMFGLEQFKRMKHTAFLINVTRGALIDQDALYIALNQGYIAGAGLDVLDPEPPAHDDPLLRLKNAIITPHMGFYSEESTTRLIKEAEEEVFRVLCGEWPKNLVNPEVKQRYLEKWR